MRNKIYNYLNSFLLLSRMSKRTRNKVSYNVDEALDYLGVIHKSISSKIADFFR